MRLEIMLRSMHRKSGSAGVKDGKGMPFDSCYPLEKGQVMNIGSKGC
jgi:hypothetical protein